MAGFEKPTRGSIRSSGSNLLFSMLSYARIHVLLGLQLRSIGGFQPEVDTVQGGAAFNTTADVDGTR